MASSTHEMATFRLGYKGARHLGQLGSEDDARVEGERAFLVSCNHPALLADPEDPATETGAILSSCWSSTDHSYICLDQRPSLFSPAGIPRGQPHVLRVLLSAGSHIRMQAPTGSLQLRKSRPRGTGSMKPVGKSRPGSRRESAATKLTTRISLKRLCRYMEHRGMSTLLVYGANQEPGTRTETRIVERNRLRRFTDRFAQSRSLSHVAIACVDFSGIK